MSSIAMNKKAIVILEYNRPEYLYICLYSLCKTNYLTDWDIIISIDGINEYHHEFKKISNDFGCVLWDWKDNVLNKRHIIRSIQKCFLYYDELIYVEGDLIFRSDTFDILSNIKREDYTFTNLNGWLPHNGKETPYFYECRGNLLNKEKWKLIEEWFNSKKYCGLLNPLYNGVEPYKLSDDYHSFEGFMSRYTRDKLGKTYFLQIPCTLHFGVMGYSGNNIEVHKRITNGSPDTWMDNVLNEYKNKTSEHFWPKNFIYK